MPFVNCECWIKSCFNKLTWNQNQNHLLDGDFKNQNQNNFSIPLKFISNQNKKNRIIWFQMMILRRGVKTTENVNSGWINSMIWDDWLKVSILVAPISLGFVNEWHASKYEKS